MRGPTVNLLSHYLYYIFHLENTVFLLNSLPYFYKMGNQESSHIASLFQKHEMYLLPILMLCIEKTNGS